MHAPHAGACGRSRRQMKKEDIRRRVDYSGAMRNVPHPEPSGSQTLLPANATDMTRVRAGLIEG